jgi:hypothetical protein
VLNGVVADHRGLEPDRPLPNWSDAAWDWPKLDVKEIEINRY